MDELLKVMEKFYEENSSREGIGEKQRRIVWATRFYELGKKDGQDVR